MPKARSYFNPLEGLTALRAPLDYIVMLGLGVFNFVLSYVNYWYPPDKVFDEIYFARAAEEYLKNMRIYENTHPPLSKLLVTLSVMMFGGLNGGDNSHGWRFLDIVFGALVVMLLFAFAKRITGSTVFATITALFLTFDGMHFVQSRIATPEGFVIFFSLAALYAFYRFWIASQVEERRHVEVPPLAFALGIAGSIAAGIVAVTIIGLAWRQIQIATMVIIALYVAMGVYLLVRYMVFPKMYSGGTFEQTFPDGSYALIEGKQSTLLTVDGNSVGSGQGKLKVAKFTDGDLTITYKADPSVTYTTPDGSATYANNEIQTDGTVEQGKSANLWLLVFTIALGLLISTKWYGVMGFPVSFIVLFLVWLQRLVLQKKPAQWGNPRGFRLDGAMVTIAFVAATIYGLAWVPDLVRHSPDPNEIHNLNDVVQRQVSMYEYHHNLKATHPYSSQWWEWPLDYVPIAYYYQDNRPPAQKQNEKACCVEEITSMPNPFILWFGLITVPLIGVLAWRERNKAYGLIVFAYLLQWLPWMLSPRLIFAYHFYTNIPLICLCDAIVLQRIWKWASSRGRQGRLYGGIAVGAMVLLIAGGFVYFYPILSAMKIPWDAWHARMWRSLDGLH